ncbi:MAG: YgiQ family radical SAM protein [Candidatus Omnitrophica bacterium]|nr:YgiQ family radical SAM protein [Candidatus Omnitrophota bacterium]
MNSFLPTSKADLKKTNWESLDIILISGDAYVDHPSYGTSVIGRVLENSGYKVGIIAQPNWRKPDDFVRLGKPRLFFGISAGNLDSMVANYTTNMHRRRSDDYSPGTKPNLRPDRAVIVYANMVRKAYSDTCIVIGGIEASLRRFAHYDFWENRVRGSILLDSRANILVYGMAEKQIVEIARRRRKNLPLTNIPGTTIAQKDTSGLGEYLELPSCEETKADRDKFNEAFRIFYRNQDPFRGKTLIQRHSGRLIVQFPPAPPLAQEELGKIFELPYMRAPHPDYNTQGGVSGFETVRFSIISNRGCCGECNFCSLYAHQGRIVTSRSKESILREVLLLTRQKNFRGTITDVGGPTANLYYSRCGRWNREGACAHKQCLMPKQCPHLKLGYRESLELYKALLALPKVKHVFIESGFRYDLLTDETAENYLKNICASHISGQMKVAPEHNVEKVLKVMNKPALASYEKFVEKYRAASAEVKKELYLVNYFISGHPGTTLQDALDLALYLIRKKIRPQQIQDFIPLPLTLSGCIFYTGKDPLTSQIIYVPRAQKERKMQRALIQYFNPKNKRLVLEALKILKKVHLRGQFHV